MKKSALVRPLYEYNPRKLGMIDDAALRKEYTRLRDIAQKRLKRLQAGGYGSSVEYVSNVGAFPTIKQMGGKVNKYKLIKLARFIASPRSTVSGQKETVKREIKALKEAGIKKITTANLTKYGEMMDYIRAVGYDVLLYSAQASSREKISLFGADFFNDIFEIWLKSDNPEEGVLNAINERSRMEGIQGFNR